LSAAGLEHFVICYPLSYPLDCGGFIEEPCVEHVIPDLSFGNVKYIVLCW